MTAAHVVIIAPPPTKPSEPPLSAAAAARLLRAWGVEATSIDASIGWHSQALGVANLNHALAWAAANGRPAVELRAFRRAVSAVTRDPSPLRCASTYRNRRVYSSAIAHLTQALRLVAAPFPGVRLGLADAELAGLRPERSIDLIRLARHPGPFDDYFTGTLFPELASRGVTHLGISLTFLPQAAAAFRLALLCSEHLPHLVRLLGGPLIDCWSAAGAPLSGEAFHLFHRVILDAEDPDLRSLAALLGGSPAGSGALRRLHTVDLEAAASPAYLAPLPIVPIALARGCPWRRCTFCPDHLHPRRASSDDGALEDWLRDVARRFPAGAMLHLTDSSLPPEQLERLATAIRRGGLPLRWHGFVRVEEVLADPAFAHHLADGGCVMLQIGVESASARLLALMGKGAGPELAQKVLRSTAAAGIRNQVYLLFGMPGETDDEREETLAFVEAEGATIHDLNHAILNLPRGSPMHRHPDRFGITEIRPFAPDTDLSLYDDFWCGASHPRMEARRWLDRRFLRSPSVRRVVGDLSAPFKANHACFL